MNISEALKLLQDGKKIYHESAPYIIYQLINKQLKIYRKYDTDDYYYLLAVTRNDISIDCENDLEGWEEKIEPIAIKQWNSIRLENK